MEEVLERELDEVERGSLEARLHFIADHADYPEQARLAKELLEFVQAKDTPTVQRRPGWIEHLLKRAEELDQKWLTQFRLKTILVAGLAIMGAWAMVDLAQWIFDLASKSPSHLEQLLQHLIAVGRLNSLTGLTWLAAETALKAGFGVILLISAGLFLGRRDQQAIRIGFFGLLLFLTGVNLLEVYWDQFATIPTALIQFTLLLILIHYRRRFTHH
jgi:hypothetical protein